MRINVDNISTLSLNTSYQEVLSRLGEPLKETEGNNLVVLRYNSNADSYAHYLYFQNNILVQKSISFVEESQTLQTYIDQFGAPEISLLRFEKPDINSSTVHVWSSRGITVITAGSNPAARVLRVQEYRTTTLSEYLETWGKIFKNHQKVKLTTTTQQVSSQQNQFLSPSKKDLQPMLFLGVLILFIFIILLLIVKRKKKSPINIHK